MDTFENSALADEDNVLEEATCWECWQQKECVRYTVCCTGTIFHICKECQEKVKSL